MSKKVTTSAVLITELARIRKTLDQLESNERSSQKALELLYQDLE